MRSLILMIVIMLAKTKPLTALSEMLHLTDIHMDPFYSVGAPNSCALDETGLGCCRDYNVARDDSRPARYFGELKCDTPVSTVELTLYTASRQWPNASLVLWSGDNAHHHDLVQTPAGNALITVSIGDRIRAYWPRATLLPVYGNHDFYPVDQFRSNWTLYQWMLGRTCRKWYWIRDPNLCQYGYYSLDLENKNNVTVLGLNSLVWDENNFIADGADAARHWAWLVGELDRARDRNRHVWIHMHIPSGSGNIEWFNANFELLVGEHFLRDGTPTVSYVFAGHTHHAEFRALRNRRREIVGATIIAPSLTPSEHHGGYRVYTLAGTEISSGDKITGFADYRLDLSRVYSTGTFVYDRLYDSRSAYGLPDLGATNLVRLIGELAKNDTAVCDYIQWYNLGFPTDCSPAKMRQVRCDMLHSNNADKTRCYTTAETGL